MLLSWLAATSARPYGDSGGYEVMLRHFLATGRVDYMKWSQPTFIGLLPVAVPWSWAFGTATASLQWLSVAFSLALLAGVWAFCQRTAGGWTALWIALGVLLLHDAVSSSASFMTDVPYAAYLVGLLLAHRELELRYASSNRSGVAALWLAWSLLFLLSTLTRSFSLVLVPVFGAQWLLSRRKAQQGSFALTCLLLSVALAALSVLTARKLGVNGFTLREITAVPLILDGDRGRLNLRALLAGVLGLAAATLPTLLLWSAKRGARSRASDVAARAWWRSATLRSVILGVAAFGSGLLFWRKGTLGSLVPLPQMESAERLIQVAQVLAGAVAVPLLARVMSCAVKDALPSKKPVFSVQNAEEEPALSHTPGVLVAIVLVHFALMPLLLHPLPRHLMPAGIALLLLAALQIQAPQPMPRAARFKAIFSGLLTLILLPSIVLGVAAQRALSQKQYDVAARLQQKGVPASKLDGGWAFFCAHNLTPGLVAAAYLPPNDYVTRFTKLQASAPYIVTDNSKAQGQRLSVHAVPLPLGRARTVLALRRVARPIRKPGRAASAAVKTRLQSLR